MSHHIPDVTKMISDTPRMKAAQMAAIEHGTGDVWRVGCDIERELNAAHVEIERLTAKVAQLYEGAEEQKQRIKRLEEFASRFLNPDDLGWAIGKYDRDEAREALGKERVESKAKEAKL